MSEVRIKVAVRVRPFNRREMEQNQRNIIRVMDKSNLIFDPEIDEDEFFFHGAKQTHRDITKRVKKKLNMEFDDVFGNDSTNIEVFQSCTKPLVQSVMEGYNCSVFVYGATGAGKTFTMLGNDDNLGITFLTMRELFDSMDKLSEERRFDIGISYLEVYNEQVVNLLTKSAPLKLREDTNGVVVGGLVLKQIYSAEELIDLLILGNRNRTQHPTDANEESSRSHAIFQVHIRMIDKTTSVRKTVKLSMIDLAGSERAQSTKCKGLRFKEGANINKSLLALGNCINKLADGSKHIPYRDSNLTRILKDSLGGNCQTLMIANISPSSLTYEDTYNTLKYASRAKKIRTTCKQNIVPSNMPKEYLLKRCNDQHSEIEKLKERIKQLENQIIDQKTYESAMNVINQAGAGGDATVSKIEVAKAVDLSGWFSKIDASYASYKKSHEQCLLLQSKEKILNFRIKFKEHYECVKKVLSLDGSRLDNDLSRLEASIDKYSKQAARIKNEDMSRWIKRFKEANRGLDSLKREIKEQSMDVPLDLYIQKKNTDLEISKTIMKANHVNKINNMYQAEMDNLKKVMVLSSEIMQDNYLLMRASGELDKTMKEKLHLLVKLLQGQRNVKFADDDTATNSTVVHTEEVSSPSSSPEHEDNNDCITFQNIMNLSDYADDMPCTSGLLKRANNDVDEEDDEIVAIETKKSKNSSSAEAMADFAFVRPKAMKAINFNAVAGNVGCSKMETDDDSNLNETFDLKPHLTRIIATSTSAPGPVAVRSTVLVEPNIKSSTSAVSKAHKLAKPNVSGSTSKFQLNVNKENKKFSPNNRIRKIPKTPNRMASKAPASLANRPRLLKSAATSSLVSATEKFKNLKK